MVTGTRKVHNMEPEQLKKLITQGESQELEFKSRLPDPKHLAKLISAFANTNGGRIIIGIRDDGSIVGVDDISHPQIEQMLVPTVLPSIRVETEILGIDDKSVLVITIPKGSQPPYLTDGRAFQRTGLVVSAITSQVLYSNIIEHARSSDDLQTEVKRLSETIETLNKELIATGKWEKKIRDMLISGLIGAIIGAGISYLISLASGS